MILEKQTLEVKTVKVPVEKPELTFHEKGVLQHFKLFPKLDRGSQDRLRREINHLRETSPTFKEAFEGGLGSLAGMVKQPQAKSSGGSVIDALLHPITAAKGKIGASLLKSRNKPPEIRVYPDPTLKEIASAWDFSKDSKADLIAIVRKLGAALRGVNYGDRLGMAAPQIGISKRVFVCQGAVCVNPSWQAPKVGEKVETFEGCYSVPGKVFKTKRDKYGWASWTSVEGEQREFKLKGINALVFQHELDHLDGKCCCDIGEEYVAPKKEEEKKA